jgi:cytochrome b6-f complex iron-sulfur subunit
MTETRKTMNRRRFLGRAALISAAAAGVTALAAGLRSIIPPLGRRDRRVVIGRLYDFPLNTFTLLAEHKIFIWRDHEGVRALSAACTHLGCIVKYAEEGFLCPCHGSRFDGEGRVLSGPAPKALPCFKIDLTADGRLQVDRRSEVPFRDKFLIS